MNRHLASPPLRTRLAVGLATIVVGAGVLACGGEAPVLELINRSDTTIAMLPGIVVPACSRSAYTKAQVDAAQDAFTTAFANGDESWIPADAVQFTSGTPGQRIGAAKPQTIIVSGTAPISVVDGPVPDEALSACGGAPIGVN